MVPEAPECECGAVIAALRWRRRPRREGLPAPQWFAYHELAAASLKTHPKKWLIIALILMESGEIVDIGGYNRLLVFELTVETLRCCATVWPMSWTNRQRAASIPAGPAMIRGRRLSCGHGA